MRRTMSIDYASRRKPETFKPLIDAALTRIAAIGEQTFTPPAEVPEGKGPFGYLCHAVELGKASLTTPAVAKALGEYSWNMNFLNGTLDKYFENDDFDLEYYPEESHECLSQYNYIGGADADVIALWQREDRTSVCHAHVEGFWILGEDPVDYIEKIAGKAEKKRKK